MTLRLHEASHDAVAGVQGAVGGVGDHGGDDGVVGPFARGDDVRVVRVEGEAGAAVLEGEARVCGDDAGAEAGEVAVDEGAGVAVAVGDGEVDGVAVAVGGGTVVEGFRGFVGVEEFGAFGEVGWGEHFVGGDFGDGRVGDEPVCVGEGDAETFDYGVEVGSGVVVALGEGRYFAGAFQFFENPKGHEGNDALAVRRMFPYIYAILVG